MLLIKQKQKNSKLPKHIWMKPYLKTRSDKSAFANIILELPLTNAIDHTLTFIHWLLIHLILLTLSILTQPPAQNSEAGTGGALKYFASLTGKKLCWILYFTTLQAFRPGTLLKRKFYTGIFLWNLRNS